MNDDRNTPPEAQERSNLLHDLEEWLERPMILLSFIWVLLVLVELVRGSTTLLMAFGTAIWLVFILEFLLKFWLAPDKVSFVRGNWLSILALVVPAFRMFRIFRTVRLLRAARGARLVRVIGTVNRSMAALRASMSRRGLGYVLALSAIVIMVGAGGMLAFESQDEVPDGFGSYGEALWWTAMLLTSIGSEYWPQSPEGRFLCFLLALYGFAVFGYITASFASFFVGRDALSPQGEVAGSVEIAALRKELAALRGALAHADAGSAARPAGEN